MFGGGQVAPLTAVLAALVTPFTVCVAVSEWPPPPNVTGTPKVPPGVADPVPTWLPPSKMSMMAKASDVPATVTIELPGTLNPLLGDVIVGAGGAIVPVTVLLAALVKLFTVSFAVSEWLPIANVMPMLKVPPAVADPVPTWVAPSKMATEALPWAVPTTVTEVLV
jgi:hypothetical protein